MLALSSYLKESKADVRVRLLFLLLTEPWESLIASWTTESDSKIVVENEELDGNDFNTEIQNKERREEPLFPASEELGSQFCYVTFS